jgi:hypothetical protein
MLDVGGYVKCTYTLGVGVNDRLPGVCVECFASAYMVSLRTIDRIRSEIRRGFVTTEARPYNDRSNEYAKSVVFAKLLVTQAASRGYYLDRRQIAAMSVPNTPAALACFAWMDDHFDMVADASPNCTHLELEPITLAEVHDEYITDMYHFKETILSLSAFCVMWKTCFQHVKIREFKQVTGKCQTCAVLTLARKTHKDRMDREHLKLLHLAHRSAYMNERLSYYTKRQQAEAQPRKYLSIITDGMQQRHNVLPWWGNIDSTSDNLPQHLQGVLAHGRFMNVYRTYHNVQLGANAQIHSCLLALEKIMRDEGRIPDTVFIQIDGGPENISKSVLALCELLVARGVTKKIVLARLMVGHTHEDIDSKFALIWRRIRSAFALTMSHYKSQVEGALHTNGLTSEVIDLFAIPDYDKLLRPLVDKNFGRYAKRVSSNDWSVLEFTFQGIDDVKQLNHFPLGVKTTYRPYTADRVLRIVKDTAAPLCMTVDQLGPITPFPPEDKAKGLPEGMCILTEFPDSLPVAEEFVVGSHQLLHNVTHKMLHKFSSDASKSIHDEWRHFRDHIAPQSDSVHEYIANVPLHIPLRAELFESRLRLEDVIASRIVELHKEWGDRSRKSIPLDYVQTSARKKQRGDPALLHPSMIVDGPPGETYSVPVYCAEPHHRRRKGAPAVAPDDVVEPSSPAVAETTSGAILVSRVAAIAEDNDSAGESHDSSSSDGATDSDAVDDDGLVMCHTPRALPHNYGNPLGFIGWKFKVIPKYAHKADYAAKCSDGVITAVVRPPGAGDDYEKLLFKCYNYTTMSEEPPSHSDAWVYVPCTQFLSSSEPRRMMKWVREKRNTEHPHTEKKQNWEYTLAPPDGLYDKLERSNMLSDEDMNAGTRTRRQRQEAKLARCRARNSRRSAVVIPGPPPSPEEEDVVSSASDNSINESEGQRQLIPPPSRPNTNATILQQHEQFKRDVHDRVRARAEKTRSEAAARGGEYHSNMTYTACGTNPRVLVRNQIPLKSIKASTLRDDPKHILLSDLSSSEDSDDNSCDNNDEF